MRAEGGAELTLPKTPAGKVWARTSRAWKRLRAAVRRRRSRSRGEDRPVGDLFCSRPFEWFEIQGGPRRGLVHLCCQSWLDHPIGLLWTRRAWGALPTHVRARVRHAEISVDAASAETYARNRGGRWETLLENLRFVAELRRDGPLEWVGLSFVVQENNFAEMPDFVALARSLGFDLVLFNQIVNWGTFSSADFKARAVHLPSHPRHGELRATLAAPVFADPIVHLGNLGPLRAAES